MADPCCRSEWAARLELRNTAEDGQGLAFAEALRMGDGPATEVEPGCATIPRRREVG